MQSIIKCICSVSRPLKMFKLLLYCIWTTWTVAIWIENRFVKLFSFSHVANSSNYYTLHCSYCCYYYFGCCYFCLCNAFHRMNRTFWLDMKKWAHTLRNILESQYMREYTYLSERFTMCARCTFPKKSNNDSNDRREPEKNVISVLADSIKLINHTHIVHRSVVYLLLVLLPIWLLFVIFIPYMCRMKCIWFQSGRLS